MTFTTTVTRARAAAVALVLPAVFAVGACGSAESPSPTGTGVSTTTTTAATGESPAPAPTTDAPGSAGDKASLIALMKAGASQTTTVHVEMTMTAAGQKIAMTGDTDSTTKDNPSMAMSMDMAGTKMKLILVDKKLYIGGMPGLAEGKFAKIDPQGDMGKQFQDAMKASDPAESIAEFEKTVTAVKFVGEETVDGAKLRHYTLTMDGSALAEEGAPDKIDTEVWVDDQGRMRQMEMDVAGMKMKSTMSKYGEPVSIKAPAKADLVEMPGL